MTAEQSGPDYLAKYTKEYFAGTGVRSGYTDYHTCSGILREWSRMLEQVAHPTSVLDVGSAYGFVLDYFQRKGVPVWGIEPSEWARDQVPAHLKPLVYAGSLPDLPATPMADVVTCTEVLEHLPEDLVAASLQALADRSSRLVVALICVGNGSGLVDPGGDETHLTLQPREWWNAHWDATGLVAEPTMEQWLNTHPISKRMHWANRFFVRQRA